MKKISFDDFTADNNKYKNKSIALCIGVFDGIHVGHQDIITQVMDSSLFSVVLTFSSNPKMASGRKQFQKPLLSEKLKTKIFSELGFDLQVIIDFSTKISRLTGDEFLQLLCKNLTIKKLIVGEDFQLGNPKASLKAFQLRDDLSSFSRETEVVITNSIVDKDNIVISSSRIRQLIIKGKMDVVHKLLGREYLLDLGLTPSQFSGNSLLMKTEDIKQLLPSSGNFIGRWVEDNILVTITIEANMLIVFPSLKSSAKNKTLAITRERVLI